MNIVKIVVIAALAFAGYHTLNKYHREGAGTASASAPASAQGFVALPPVTGAKPGAVLVIAAENCPEEAAQRADRLAEDLTRQGIPVSRMHNVSFEIPNNDSSVANKVMATMNGELPIVFVRDKAKSNPTLEEVTAEYRAGAQ